MHGPPTAADLLHFRPVTGMPMASFISLAKTVISGPQQKHLVIAPAAVISVTIAAALIVSLPIKKVASPAVVLKIDFFM